jgi:hypothetical protein
VARQIRKQNQAEHRWLTSAIPATKKAEIRRIEVQSQPRQIVRETLSQNNPSQIRWRRELVE